MKKPEKILSDFTKNVGYFMATTNDWRRESALMYKIRDSRPLVDNEVKQRAYNLDIATAPEQSQNLTVVSVAPAYIRAIIGTMVMNRKTFAARCLDPEYSPETDVMSDSIKWATTVSRFNSRYALAVEDAIIRGVGATVTSLDFSRKQYPSGYPVTEKKDFIFFDRGGMDDLASDSIEWCGYADPMYVDTLDEYIEANGGFKTEGGIAGGYKEQLMQYVSAEDTDRIDFLYHYFWREFVTVHDCENFFITKAELIAPTDKQEVYEYLGLFASKHQLDLERSRYWVLDKDAYKDYKIVIQVLREQFGIDLGELEHTTRRAMCYYRAQIARGNLIMSSQSYTQECHPMNILTAYYDRATGCYYGLMRAAAYLQEMINGAFDDFQRYANRSSTGGNVGLKGVGTELANTIQSIREKEQSFPLPANGEIIPIGSPDAGQAMLGFSTLLIDTLPLVLGVPREILGAINTDTPAASLYKMITRQMQVSLSHVMNNCDSYLWNQGCIYRDLIVEMAQNSDGMVLPRLSPTFGQEGTMLLSKQNIGRNYSMVVQNQDSSEDERHDEFLKIVEFLQLLPEQQRAAAVPELVKLSNFGEESKQALLALFQPAAPVEPDPMALELQQAQIALVKAQAADLAAGAEKKSAEAQKVAAAVDMADAQSVADVYKTVSEIEVNKSKTGAPMPEFTI